jgi:hypothetical protein
MFNENSSGCESAAVTAMAGFQISDAMYVGYSYDFELPD